MTQPLKVTRLPVELVVFDWDGTLMDSADRIIACMQGAAENIGLEPAGPEAIRNLIGLSLPETYGRLYPHIDTATVARLTASYREFWLERDHLPMPLFDGVTAGLAQLESAGLLLGVATGKARRGLDRVLGQSGLETRFAATRCADEARPKPDPAMLLDVLDRTGVEAGAAIMVGDTSYDMQMASAAGVVGIGVDWGSHTPDTLNEHGAAQVFSDFPSLIQSLTATSPGIAC